MRARSQPVQGSTPSQLVSHLLQEHEILLEEHSVSAAQRRRERLEVFRLTGAMLQ